MASGLGSTTSFQELLLLQLLNVKKSKDKFGTMDPNPAERCLATSNDTPRQALIPQYHGICERNHYSSFFYIP
ncbi:hypothetical protein V5799_008988 [Amblyomma americanum]|uniref:Uncharacterized protein n=1 Tax=Amblyomma americanum TaxID=6943 RepID=A0AAQ4FD98_AMBAM